jgi:hypothetical protein
VLLLLPFLLLEVQHLHLQLVHLQLMSLQLVLANMALLVQTTLVLSLRPSQANGCPAQDVSHRGPQRLGPLCTCVRSFPLHC